MCQGPESCSAAEFQEPPFPRKKLVLLRSHKILLNRAKTDVLLLLSLIIILVLQQGPAERCSEERRACKLMLLRFFSATWAPSLGETWREHGHPPTTTIRKQGEPLRKKGMHRRQREGLSPLTVATEKQIALQRKWLNLLLGLTNMRPYHVSSSDIDESKSFFPYLVLMICGVPFPTVLDALIFYVRPVECNLF